MIRSKPILLLDFPFYHTWFGIIAVILVFTTSGKKVYFYYLTKTRAVARSENPGGLVVLGGDNVPPLVEIGLTDQPKAVGAKASQPPRLRQACFRENTKQVRDCIPEVYGW